MSRTPKSKKGKEKRHSKLNVLVSHPNDYIGRSTKHKFYSVNIKTLAQIIKTGSFQDISFVEKIKNVRESFFDKDKLKSKLPFLTIMSIFHENEDGLSNINAESVKRLTNYIFIDIDFKHNQELSQEHIVEQLKKLPYIKCFWRSSSNNGLHAIIEYKLQKTYQNIYNFKNIIQFVHNKFKLDLPEIKADKSCMDISRKSFLSYDPNIYTAKKCIPLNIDIKDIVDKEYIYNNNNTSYIHPSSNSYIGENVNSVRIPESIYSSGFLDDFYRMRCVDFLNKYKNEYKIILSSDYVQFEKEQMKRDSRSVVFDFNRNVVGFNWRYDNSGDKPIRYAKPVKEGFRHKTMLERLTHQRICKRDASFNQLLYNAVYNRCLSINTEWPEEKKELFSIVNSVLKLSNDDLDRIFRENRHKLPRAKANKNFKGKRKSKTLSGDVKMDITERKRIIIGFICWDGNLTYERIDTINHILYHEGLTKKELSFNTIERHLVAIGLGKRAINAREIESKISKIDYTKSQKENAENLGISERTIRRYYQKNNKSYRKEKQNKTIIIQLSSNTLNNYDIPLNLYHHYKNICSNFINTNAP